MLVKTSSRLMTFGAMGFEFAVLVVLGLLAGLKVDAWLGISPGGVLVGIVIGMTGAVLRLMSYLKFLKAENQREDEEL